MKKTGYVKAIPVTEIVEGMQVLLNDIVCKIHKNGIFALEGHYLDEWKYFEGDLKTLVVEYEKVVKMQGSNKGWITKPQLPLKYSQWSRAVINSEVDNPEKPVRFNFISFTDGIQGAKIIPPRQAKTYTEDQVEYKINCILNQLLIHDYRKIKELNHSNAIADYIIEWWAKNK